MCNRLYGCQRRAITGRVIVIDQCPAIGLGLSREAIPRVVLAGVRAITVGRTHPLANRVVAVADALAIRVVFIVVVIS